ncbi:MAG: hypothetical protein ACC628_04465 [Pirellulaceae bacterium]
MMERIDPPRWVFQAARLPHMPHMVLSLLLSLATTSSLKAASPNVRFDTACVVACRDVSSEEFTAANPGERLLEVRLEVSSLIVHGAEENLLQYFYQFTSPNRSLQVADYRPRTTPASEYAGNIGIEMRKETSKSAGIAVTGAWDNLIKATGTGDMGSRDSSSVRYELVAPQESLAASGTICRGYGVYFKLKHMRQSLLEGSKEFVLVFRAPRGWRGDFVHVHCQAKGRSRGVIRQLDEEVSWGRNDFLVALHLEADEESKRIAEEFVDAAIKLRRAAARNQRVIHKRNYPTVFHEFGSLLGAVEPKLSDTWLSEVLYLSGHQRLERIADRLPEEVRAAAIDYVAVRDELQQLRE